MGIETVERIVSNRLNSEWVGKTPILWDNSKESPVRGVDFIRPIVEGLSSEILSSTCQKEYYLLTIQVFTVFGSGTGDNNRYADEIAKMFYGYSEEYLECLTAFIDRIGQDQEWHQNNVILDLTYYNHF